MHVVVTGASGFVGSHLIPALKQAGHSVTAFVRDVRRYDAPEGVDVREGDLLEPKTLRNAFTDADAVYYLVHSLKSGADFAARDRRAAKNFVDAVESANVGRVIYLGGLGETTDGLSEHLTSRQDVETVLARGDYTLTTLRAAIIIGAGSASFEMIRQLCERLPVMITPKWVRTRCQPISIDDVIMYLISVLEVPETAGKTFQIGGPDVMTYEEMLRRTAEQLGKRQILVPIPILSPKLSVYWVDLVTDIPKSVAHPLIYGLKNPVVVTDDRINDLVQIELTSFDVAVARALDSNE